MTFQDGSGEVLEIARRYCKPRAVARLLKDLHAAAGLEGKPDGPPSAGSPVRTRRCAGETGANTAGREELDHLVTLCYETLPPSDFMQALLEMGDALVQQGDLRRAEDLYSVVLAHQETRGQQRFVADAYLRRGELHSRQGNWKASSADLQQSRSLFADLKEHTAVGRIENILGTNFAQQGNLKLARKYYRRALGVFEAAERTDMTGTVLMNLGILSTIAGKYAEALVYYKRAQSCFEVLGDIRRLAELHHNLGMVHLARGHEDDARREFNTSFFLASKRNLVQVMGLASMGKAAASCRCRDYPLAAKLVNQAMEYFTKTNDRLSLADAYKIKGMVHRDMKKHSLAASYFQTSLRINRELGNRLNAAETLFEIGMLDKLQGKKAEAVKALQEAECLFQAVGADEDVRRTREQIKPLCLSEKTR